MADTYNPILNKQESRGWQLFQQLPIPEPGTALVFSGNEQHFLTGTQGQRRPSRGEMLWGKYNLLYKVDMTEHPLSFLCELPCATDAFDFHADVRFTCAVHNPEMIVRRNVTDVRQVLEPLIVEVMRSMSRNYQVEESGIAEREIGDRVKKAVYDVGFQLNRFVLTLSLEQEARQRIRQKKDIQDRAELEKTRSQSSIELEKEAQKLYLQRQQFEEQMQQLFELERRNLQEQLQSQIGESEQQSLQELTRLREQFKLASNIKAPNNKISQPSIQEHRGISSTADNVVASGFPSLASLRAAHSELLKRHREIGSTTELLTEIEEFIYRGRATGALLDSDEDRWASQSLLDYWSAILYRAGREPPDATLAEFDSALAPELDDARCPYLGLEAFREEKSNLFYGRQRLLEKLVNHLKKNRLLTVVGSSGSGKSSVALGGLLPKLKVGALPGSENWHYYSPMVPGVNPLENLARLTQPRDVNATEWLQQQVESFQRDPNHLSKLSNEFGDSPSVLVVDQFEEVFTLCRDDSVRQAFIDNLISLIQSPGVRHTVILTMRTDFESQVARVPVFKDLFEQAQVRVTALDASELREAIEKPAELVGLKFEEGLVEALLQDVLGEPAALPLLQFTLLKLWDNRERNRVTWETYKRLGGGRQALARSADEFYEQLIPEEQVTVKRILLRMVRPTEGLEVTSNRIQRKTLYQTGEARDRVDRVLDKLIQVRLVRLTEGDTPDDAQVEVAHEALVRNWPRLVNWLEDERVNMRQRLRLTVVAEQWKAHGKDRSALLRGKLLKEARSYQDLDELETEFVQHCIRVEQKRRFFSFSVLVAFLSLTGLSTFAWYEAKLAKQQELRALLQLQKPLTLAQDPGSSTFEVSFSPNKKFIAANSKDGTVRLWNLQSEELKTLSSHESRITSVVFSPDGTLIATGSEDGTVRLWNLEGKELKMFSSHEGRITSVVFSSDGTLIATTSKDGTILWDLQGNNIAEFSHGND